MPANFQNLFSVGLSAFLLSSCAIPKADYALIPPPGSTREKQASDIKECWQLPRTLSEAPLSDVEKRRIGDVETGRFSEGGRGRSLSSQHYLLCLLDKDYQLLEMPLSWMPDSACETLSKYQSAGIEKDRLIDLCTNPTYEQCKQCRSLK